MDGKRPPFEATPKKALDLDTGLTVAEEKGAWVSSREGKRVATFSIYEEQVHEGQTYRFLIQVILEVYPK